MRMRVGIKQKMLLLLIALLAITITSLALLAAYSIDRQNESAAFTELDRDLRAWHRDLEQSVFHLRDVALKEVADPPAMDLLSQLLVLQLKVDDPRESAIAPGLSRTLGYEKSVALGRLLPVLRASGFSDIAVYLRGRLSHVVSPAGAGMMIRGITHSGELWLSGSRSADGALFLQSWPAWRADGPPQGWRLTLEGPSVPTVAFAYPSPQATTIEIAIPVMGRTEAFPIYGTRTVDQFISELTIPDARSTDTADSAQPRSILAVVVFRKLLDRATLEEIHERTGKWAAIFSLDGTHHQQLGAAVSFNPALLSEVTAGAPATLSRIFHRTINANNSSYYQALTPWHFNGQTPFILSVTASREPTLHNVRQTLSATALVAGCLLALSAALGAFWVRRFIDPIVALTAAVKTIGDKTYVAADLTSNPITSYEELKPVEVRATDEVGDLASAFNAMVAQLRRSIETLEQQVQVRTAEAMRLARARSDFLAQMSHELRTPLNAILGYTQMLLRDVHLTKRQMRGLSTIQESGQHLLSLINDILDLAQMQAAKLKLDLADVALEPFLRTVTNIMRVKAQEKSLQFRFEARDLPAGVRLDPKRLRQILLNLLGNAIKFTDTGSVTVRVQADAAVAQAVAGTDAARTRLRFEVEDTGIGMTEEQLARLFQPFEQLAEPKRREGGTGLGLAISSSLVELMGGKAQVRSEPGKGSRFWFEIEVPVVDILTGRPISRKAPTSYTGARRKILVVDDVVPNRSMLVELLSNLGFTVSDAADGHEAVQQAQRVVPDLILMDLVMPVIDGFEATRQIHKTPGLERVPVIALSASAGPEEQAKSSAAGAAAFLAKPIDHDALLQTIAEQLQLHWTYDELPATLPASEPVPGTWVMPPPQELEQLYQAALAGSMRDIQRLANHVRSLGEAYAPFAARLSMLAEDYQSRALLQLLTECREAAGTTAAPGSASDAASAKTNI
jgi:signal transduction histidine kinase/DNA-binding NarL/FixJ family response regulator